MAKRLLALILFVLLAVGLPLFLYDSLRAQDLPPLPSIPAERRLFDADRDKLFDNLKARIDVADPTEKIEVIILFEQPLDQLDFGALSKSR